MLQVVPKQTKHSYVFLPFALGETTITRKLSPTIATDGSISTAKAPVGGGQPGYMLGYYHQYVPGANGGYRVVLAQPTYYPPYTGFPTLQHACHPYFVIYTAVQHLEQRHRLTDAQLQVYSNLRAIVALWDDLKEFPVDVNYGQPGWAPGKGIQVPSGSIISVKRAGPADASGGDSSSKCTRRRIDGKCELDDQEGLA
ncbi:hypothetical protein BV25DRAFT_1824740 [Artomyces pyxidatus]|uniref:Uncharacterized protein n=1 Tax=Artomyces pyxidatus TaxID=48021 RepID=A0ACB8T348_9AGAM|nr:hypothetical protein BV25DRAFT_1824740 [Artomyces pyxidatus]